MLIFPNVINPSEFREISKAWVFPRKDDSIGSFIGLNLIHTTIAMKRLAGVAAEVCHLHESGY